MKVYIVNEAQYCKNCAQSEIESLGAWATASATRDGALLDLRNVIDERIYEAFEGLDETERDERTDSERDEVLARGGDKYSWENADYAYLWRIVEAEV